MEHEHNRGNINSMNAFLVIDTDWYNPQNTDTIHTLNIP